MVKWYHLSFGTIERRFDSCYRDQILIMGDWRNWERNCFASNSQEFESLILHHIRMKIENVISNKIVY